jgi:hypothetical protein
MASTITDNLSGYRDRVRRWLHEVTAGNSFWSNTFIDQQLNTSYRRRSGQLVMAHEGFFTNTATRDLVADQERYAWPPGFERLLKMELIRTDGTRVPVERDERHYRVNFVESGQGGRDSFMPTYRPIGGGFVLEPPPKEAVTDGLRIEYHGLPSALAADGDSWHPDFPRSFDEMIILDTVIACLDSENLMETGAVRSVLRMRSEWELDWERYIDGRMVSTNKVTPFVPHYGDA